MDEIKSSASLLMGGDRMIRVKHYIDFDERKVIARYEDGVYGNTLRAGRIVLNEARRLIDRKAPLPSRPFESPRSVTGRLVRSLKINAKKRRGKVEMNIGADGRIAKYALYLEYGTSKMAPRPFLRRALWNKRKEILKEVNRPID
jgi:HK97 gp10 family phage protein